MKRLFYLLVVLAFESCTMVYFNSPQSANGERLTSVPPELQGKWIDNRDTTIVTSAGEYHAEISKDSLGNEIVNRSWTNLSDSILLFKSGKYYIVNILDESGNGFVVAVMDLQGNGDINWYYPFEPPFFGKRRGLQVDSVVRFRETGKSENQKLDHRKDKSLKSNKHEYIHAVYYSGKLNNDDIKNIMTSKNLFYVRKKDGSVLKPREK